MNKQYSIGLELLILVLSILFCASISSLILQYVFSTLNIDFTQSTSNIYLSRALATQVGGFICGFAIYLKLTNQSFNSTISIHRPNLKMVGLVILIFFISLPIMTGLTYFNSFLKDVIPNNSFIIAEQKIHLAQKLLLQNTGPAKLFIKLIIMAFLPAVAEELVFRGVILAKIKKASNNEHYAVIVTAILFAIIHFQPSHLLSMIFLAIAIGYLYTKTNNIFYSILFHFIFNASTILSAHYFNVNL